VNFVPTYGAGTQTESSLNTAGKIAAVHVAMLNLMGTTIVPSRFYVADWPDEYVPGQRNTSNSVAREHSDITILTKHLKGTLTGLVVNKQ